jgi:deoxycytidylate deaminase
MVDSQNARCGAKRHNYNDMKNMNQIKGSITSEYYECLDDVCVKHSNDRQRYYLDVAAKIASKSPMGHKHGALLVYKGKIISTGHNYYFLNSSIHAEVAALSCIRGNQRRLLPECELYVVRIGPDKFNNPLKYSKPCCKCQNAILKHNIKKAFYSTNYDYDNLLESVRMCITQ